MASIQPTLITTVRGTEAWLYLGPDERGRELEIIAIEVLQDTTVPYFLVMHVMPIQLRG